MREGWGKVRGEGHIPPLEPLPKWNRTTVRRVLTAIATIAGTLTLGAPKRW